MAVLDTLEWLVEAFRRGVLSRQCTSHTGGQDLEKPTSQRIVLVPLSNSEQIASVRARGLPGSVTASISAYRAHEAMEGN